MLIIGNASRRRLLGLAAAAAATHWLPRSAWAQAPKWTRDPFALGVASGSPTPEGIVLWTRLVGDVGSAPVTVRWEIAHDEAFSRIVRTGQSQAIAELAHSVHVEVTGLEPDRRYFYRFMAGDATSATGRTRTMPAGDADVAKLRVAYASCQRYEHGYFSAWRHLLADEPDLVVFLGDYIYESAAGRTALRSFPGGAALTLEDYRARYALYKGEHELQAIHAACPWIVTWDDHEVQNDYAGTTRGSGVASAGPFLARRAAAYQAFYEHMPLPASMLTRAVEGLASGAEVRLYAQYRVGRLANFVLLDDRQYRDPQACNAPGRPGSGEVALHDCAALADPARTLLGPAQERWLAQALAQPQPTWTVIGQQTLFGARLWEEAGGTVVWNDGWDGYPAARRRLTEALQRTRPANTVMLGGDMHENWVGHVKADYADPASTSLGVEFCGTSITSRSNGNARVPGWLAQNPHLVFGEASRKGYGLVDFTPKGLVATLRVLGDVARRDTGAETLARFAIAAGRPVVERA